ncbi:MAG TPA: bifunctional phosphopantothenoylcysteine decarboxylase/phosphopantothenate--cysteine ligase CoaBC [Ignavibacteria bacterium]|nr:bifunctional phosphopantothenoylcysteine decarboxylase/phosphopantothenate--cysteine ligase CoaBC [Ignavibacteria bacterium]
MAKRKILIGVTGGIAAYKIPFLVREFIKADCEVKIIMTPAAINFVTPYTLSVLSKNEVLIDFFPDAKSENDDKNNIVEVNSKTWHVNLGLWADIFLIAPATCNTISKVVNGISDNLLLTTILSARCPIIFSPAMDDDMFKNIVIQENMKKLETLGYKVIPPEEGELASGLYGQGRMPEPDKLFKLTIEYLNELKDLNGKKVLVTAGPTREFIDPVRFISNPSSGKMGFEVAIAAFERGADVTLISGPVNLSAPKEINLLKVITTNEMFESVMNNLDDKDYVIMTAAVEDITPANSSKSKLKKESFKNKFTIDFENTIDILEYIGKNKKNFKLAGFALETDNGEENARKKLEKKNLDFIVLNNPNDKDAGFGTDTNKVKFIDKDNIENIPMKSKREIADLILDKLIKL